MLNRQIKAGVRYACIGIFWVISIPSFGQLPEFSTTWSSDELNFKSSQLDVIGTDADGGFYVVKEYPKGSPKHFDLEHYDKNLHLLNSIDLRKKDKGNKETIEKVLQWHHKLVAVFSEVDDHNDKLFLYTRPLDDTSLQSGEQRKMLCEIDFTGHIVSEKRFECTFSSDSSRLFIIRNFSMIGDSRDYYSCNLFDGEFNLLWQKMTEFPYAGAQFSVRNIRLNNRRDVFILGRADNEYDMVALISDGDSLVRFPVRLPGHHVTGAQIELVDDTRLICAGFYSNSEGQNVTGTYFLTIDPTTKKIKSRSVNKFDLEFILQDQTEDDLRLMIQRGERGEPAELFNYSLDKIRVDKDGSTILIGEQRFANVSVLHGTTMIMTREVTISSGRPSPIATHSNQRVSPGRTITPITAGKDQYLANDILVVKLDSTGHLLWCRKIHKSQNSTGDDGVYSSFLSGPIKQKLCFLFNDNPLNLNEEWQNRQREFKGRKSIVVMVNLTEDGEPIRNWIYQTAENEIRLVPDMSKWISDSQLILLGKRGKFQQLGLVTFK